jgi:hypothetical protein
MREKKLTPLFTANFRKLQRLYFDVVLAVGCVGHDATDGWFSIKR